MIIVEGPDNAGKSTLCKALKERFDQRVFLEAWPDYPRSELKASVKDRTYLALAQAVKTEPTKTPVYDRLFFSELVYGEVLRGGSAFSPTEERHICRVLTAISPPIVFCLPPLDVVLSNIYERGQMEGVTENAASLYNTYQNLSMLARPKITIYDWTRGPAALDRVCRIIDAYLQRRDKRVW